MMFKVCFNFLSLTNTVKAHKMKLSRTDYEIIKFVIITMPMLVLIIYGFFKHGAFYFFKNWDLLAIGILFGILVTSLYRFFWLKLYLEPKPKPTMDTMELNQYIDEWNEWADANEKQHIICC